MLPGYNSFNMNQDIQIKKLDRGNRQLIRQIARWYYEEWETSIERTVQRLTNQPGRHTLFQLVLTYGGIPVATGGLAHRVNIYQIHEQLKDYGPWVALLYTVKEFRNRGFGSMLLDQIERFGREDQLSNIYLYTFTAESLYRKKGWKVVERVHYKGRDTAVMVKPLL